MWNFVSFSFNFSSRELFRFFSHRKMLALNESTHALVYAHCWLFMRKKTRIRNLGIIRMDLFSLLLVIEVSNNTSNKYKCSLFTFMSALNDHLPRFIGRWPSQMQSLLAEYVTNSNEICTRTSERARVARNQQQNKSMKYIAVRYEYWRNFLCINAHADVMTDFWRFTLW